MTSFGPSPREQDVLRELMAGKATDQIAEALSLSPYTVSHHLKRLRGIYHAEHTLDLVCTLWRRRFDEVTSQLRECERALAVLDRRGRTDRGGIGD